MNKLILVINTIASMIADFLYAPIIRAHLRNVSLKVPLFPGQFWFLPHLGQVKIMSVSDTHVSYQAIDTDDDVYHCSRRDFTTFGQSSPDSDSGQVIPFKVHTKKEEE
jgi:hypothetical protein